MNHIDQAQACMYDDEIHLLLPYEATKVEAHTKKVMRQISDYLREKCADIVRLRMRSELSVHGVNIQKCIVEVDVTFADEAGERKRCIADVQVGTVYNADDEMGRFGVRDIDESNLATALAGVIPVIPERIDDPDQLLLFPL